MGSLKDSLLALAAVRKKAVKIEGQKYFVREVGAVEFAAYGVEQKSDRQEAVSKLLASCVVDEEGKELLTLDEARTIAKTARVALPLVNAIMEVSGVTSEKESDAS